MRLYISCTKSLKSHVYFTLCTVHLRSEGLISGAQYPHPCPVLCSYHTVQDRARAMIFKLCPMEPRHPQECSRDSRNAWLYFHF